MPAPTFSAPDARHVRRLSLQAKRKQDARKASISIEDALRTANIPRADQGTYYLIRKLDLGSIPAGLSPTLLSLRIEKVAKSISSQAVPFNRPYADRTNVVYFPSHQEALIQLAIQLIKGVPLRAWYWSKIVPNRVSKALSTSHLAPILNQLFREPNPYRAIGRLVPQALASSNLQAFIEALPRSEIQFWLHDAHIYIADTELSSLVHESSIHPTVQFLLERVRHYISTDNPRTLFLTIATLSHYSPRSTSPHQLLRTAERAIFLFEKTSYFKAHLTPDQSPSGLTYSPSEQPTKESFRKPASEPRPQNASPERSTPPTPSSDSPIESTLHDANTQQLSTPPYKTASNFCGIVFVIPLLSQLGFQKHPKRFPPSLETSFTTHLLIHILERLGATKDEPLLNILSARCEDEESPPLESLELWYAAAKKDAKRRLKIPLKTLVERSGSVRFSETHLDIYFDYSKIDLRIRRAALDVNPGWTPSLAWVISIHYLDIHELNA